MPLTSGTKLGPYEILSALGAGGMGEVYKARDSRLNRDVAVKILPASFAADADRLQRFAQESRAAAALNHPNILSIFDIGDDRGTPYVVFELLEGETLRDRLRTGALSSRKAIDYSQQVGKGLAAAHEKGIVHRDLKPENIFITHDGRAKILDFGLAKITRPEPDAAGDAPTLQANTETGTVMGTVGYMSPEQVRGKPADPRSDIFAFGAILYEMLSGKRAFRGESTADTMSAILKEDPPELTETNRTISPALDRVVRHCLEKNAAERFQSARDVVFNLEALVGISGSSRSGVRVLPETRRINPWLVRGIAALLVLAIWAAVEHFGRGKAIRSPTFREITYRNGSIWDARFGPDGQSIIYAAEWEGNPTEIFLTRFDSSDSRSAGLPTARLLSVSSKGELAISLHPLDFDGFSEVGTLARIPLAGGAPREVLDNVLDAEWTPDGQSLAVIRPGVTAQTQLEYPIGNVIYLPEGWVNRVRFSPNGELIAIADHVPTGDDGRVVILDQKGNHKVSSSFYSSLQGVAWAPNGKEVWFSASPAGAERSIYALDLSGKERLIFRSPGGLTLHDISRTGTVLLTTDKARMTISALAPGATQERSLPWFDWSLLSDLAQDGTAVVFSETGEAVGSNYGIFLRKTDGSPAIRLGDGYTGTISPDGQWVLALVGSPGRMILLPTGVGQPRPLAYDKSEPFQLSWLPDSKSIVFSAADPGHAPRTYRLDLQSGAPRAITPEGTVGSRITPDRKLLAVDSKHTYWFFPVDGGEPQKAAFALKHEESVVRFIDDGRTLVVRTRSMPLQLTRIDVATGRREPWKEIVPPDPAGVRTIPTLKTSADGKSYAYCVTRILSDLYVVDGLK